MTVRANHGKAPVQPRTPFHSPLLVRLLAGLDPAAPPAAAAQPRASVGERLGSWLGWTDAIALSQVLNQPHARPPASAARSATAAQGAAALARVRDSVSRGILQDPVAPHGSTQLPDLADYRRFAQARQRAMAAAIGPLRAQLRGLLATTSAAGAHLAALDATLDAALGEREHHSLAGVVPQLERHFQRLQQAQAPHWRDSVHQTLQQVLLAELDLRLLPAQGLLDALGEAA